MPEKDAADRAGRLLAEDACHSVHAAVSAAWALHSRTPVAPNEAWIAERADRWATTIRAEYAKDAPPERAVLPVGGLFKCDHCGGKLTLYEDTRLWQCDRCHKPRVETPRWTTERPTEPGWYWLRNVMFEWGCPQADADYLRPIFRSGWGPIVVEFEHDSVSVPHFMGDCHCGELWQFPEEAEWSGPLAPPE